MTINLYTIFQNDEVQALSKIWQRCRDTFSGEDAVKAGGETYLSRLGGQSDDNYESYKNRSRFYNSFAKTVNSLVGLALRKPIVMDNPPSLDLCLDNIDRHGADVQSYIKESLTEVLITGRYGTLVDFDTIESQEQKKGKPYWIGYKAENILDYEYDNTLGKGGLVYIVLRECLSERSRFFQTTNHTIRYRILRLVDGVYTQEIKIEKEDGKGETIEKFTPLLNDEPLDYIPFLMHETDFSQQIKLPPLLDLVNLCVSYYRLKADHMHALHFVALPTPWVTGMDPTSASKPTTIGPQSIWMISEPDAKVGLLEFTGEGVAAIKEELAVMEQQMAILGARILLPESIGEKTATASKLRSISETSELSAIIMVLEKQFNILLSVTAVWEGVETNVSIKLPRNFIPNDLDANMITALIAGWQSGAYDYDTLINKLKEAEVIDVNKTLEEIELNVAANPPIVNNEIGNPSNPSDT